MVGALGTAGQNPPALADIRMDHNGRIFALAERIESNTRAPPPPISAGGYSPVDQIRFKHVFTLLKLLSMRSESINLKH